MNELLALSDGEQETLLKRLTHHALCKMRGLTWRGAYVKKGGAVPGGYEPHDFALDAIKKLLDGRRTWNKADHSTLEAALRAIIDSDISHMVRSRENAKVRRVPEFGDNAEAFDLPGAEPEPLTIVIDTEWQNRCHTAVLKELNGDEFLENLFWCLDGGVTKPEEIAELLGKPVEEVNNAKKRLRRKLAKLDKVFTPPKRRAK